VHLAEFGVPDMQDASLTIDVLSLQRCSVSVFAAGPSENPLADRPAETADLGRPRLACASAASPPSRKRFFKRFTCCTLKENSAAVLTHAVSLLTQLKITATRCNSR
jgi:hypothetical protein